MAYEKCELCGRRKKSVHDGQCLECHVLTCDMPVCECVGKQTLYHKSNWIERMIMPVTNDGCFCKYKAECEYN